MDLSIALIIENRLGCRVIFFLNLKFNQFSTVEGVSVPFTADDIVLLSRTSVITVFQMELYFIIAGVCI